MSKFHVRGKVVDTVELLRKRNLPWRFDVWPFAIVYTAWIVALISSLNIVDAFIVLGGLVAVHVLVFLFTVWSVDFKCFIQYSKVGDPLEKAAVKGIEWSYRSDEKAMPKKGNGNAVQIMQRYHFASHLKRMAVVRVEEQFFAFVKGAPETIQGRLTDVPSTYVKTYKKYTRQGSRVLALAFKSLPEMTVSEARSLNRDMVESELIFAGFALFSCPIRGDSAFVLSELRGSSHDLVIVTGDQALTALMLLGR